MNKLVTGDLKQYYLNWKSIGNDDIILGIIKNALKNDFKEKPRYICVPKIQYSTKAMQHRKKRIQNQKLKIYYIKKLL